MNMVTNAYAALVLRRAAKWLKANPDKHITGVAATGRDGVSIHPQHYRATCFCAVGRITREIHDLRDAPHFVLDAVFSDTPASMVVQLNDRSSDKSEVIDKLTQMADKLYSKSVLLSAGKVVL